MWAVRNRKRRKEVKRGSLSVRVPLEMPYLLTPLLLTVLVTVSNCYELKGFKRPVTNTACQRLSLQPGAIRVAVIFDRKLVYVVIG